MLLVSRFLESTSVEKQITSHFWRRLVLLVSRFLESTSVVKQVTSHFLENISVTSVTFTGEH